MERLTYSIRETALLLGISKSYTYQLAKEGKIPVLTLGRRKVVPRKVLEQWIQENSMIQEEK